MKSIPLRHISEALKEPEFSGSFSIRDVETLLSGKDMIQELHRHDFYYVLVLDKGSGEHQIDFVPYPVQDHTVFFMRPGQVHQLVLKKGSAGYLMGFTGDFYAPFEKSSEELFRKVRSKNYCKPPAERFSRMLAIMAGITGEYTGRQERYLEAIRSGLDLFFIELFRQCQHAENAAGGNSYMQERLEALQELIVLHFNEQKQTAFYAAQLHLTTYQLNAVTKAALGKTCPEVISDYILLEAKRYLLATTNQVNQVAWHLGYEDVSYFIRFFKKHTGYSPEAFREKFK